MGASRRPTLSEAVAHAAAGKRMTCALSLLFS